MAKQNNFIPVGWQFALGGTAGMMATCVVQPLDLVKVRMQLSAAAADGVIVAKYRNSAHALRSVVGSEGFFALYNGLSAGLFRQATYTMSRLGIYMTLMDILTKRNQGDVPFFQKALAAMTAGGLGSVVGTPADGRLPVEQQRGYRHVFDALIRVVREEGVLGLWRGCSSTVTRAVVLNVGQLSTYTQAKEVIGKATGMEDGIGLHLSASSVSAITATVVSMPVDMCKTRLQNMKIINGVPEYKGSIDVLRKVARGSGVLSWWKGFTPYLFRLGPHTILTFIFVEQLKRIYLQRRRKAEDW